MTTPRQEAEQELAYVVGKDRAAQLLNAVVTETQAAAFREAADLIKSDDACARPAHQDYYVLLLRQRAEQLLGEATR